MTVISVILLKMPRISDVASSADVANYWSIDEEIYQVCNNNSDSDLDGNNSVSYESENISSDSDHPQTHTHQPAPRVHGRGCGGGRGAANQADNPPVRNRINCIWSQAIRPPVNNQFSGNPGLSALVDIQDNAIKMGFVEKLDISAKVPLHKAKCFETYHSNKQFFD